LVLCLVFLPFVWWAAAITACAIAPDKNFIQILETLSEKLEQPFFITYTPYTFKCILIFTAAYFLGIGIYESQKRNKLAAGVVCSKRLLNQAVGKSLRTHNLKPKKGAQVMRKNEKITALYERLSRDDFGKDDDQQRESNSISNQKAMLEEFAARQGFTNIVHFTDDGISGTCFDRPGFLAMMKEVEAGNVEYLCIKDMSRMGRDYLKVGQIMEILRQRGVRLIAINDGVDSARGDDDFTPFRNIMNEYYARDTSRKIRSTFQSKGKSGKHLTGTVIYGYLWNEARDQWLVDPEAAEVVKRIFAMTIEGYGPYQIASKLKEEKVLIPSAYLAQHGEGVNKNKTFKDVYGWGSSTICNILEKREYLGHTINFKTRKHFKDKKSHYVPEDEWTIFENTHEAISLTSRPLTLCRKSVGMSDATRTAGAKQLPSQACFIVPIAAARCMSTAPTTASVFLNIPVPNTAKSQLEQLCTTQHRINEDVVLSLVSEMLKAIAEYAKHDRAEFVRVVQEAQSSQQTAEVRKQRTRLATAKQRVSELEVLLCKIYEDNILGKLSDSRYATLDAQYEKEQSELTAEISVLEKAVKSYEKHEKDADRFIALIDKYENFDKLTIAMLNEFIEKILVHERDRKGSIQTTQEVEIYFNFVGRFVPPAFGEVELTPEELEEIRKREERKDRLHQNYLKRKASGAQKRYEDKIKGEKRQKSKPRKPPFVRRTLQRACSSLSAVYRRESR
jgi:site-specific DNA recombinase